MKEDLQAVNLAGVNLQYWFNGPSNVPDTQDALSIFAFSCLDASASLGIHQYYTLDRAKRNLKLKNSGGIPEST